jgi:hypothetical protein
MVSARHVNLVHAAFCSTKLARSFTTGYNHEEGVAFLLNKLVAFPSKNGSIGVLRRFGAVFFDI